ncbi:MULTISPECIES: FHA domain-containing protein FhaB/FipA [unclassified Brevibacterium]|uniref:FHA domain-containing protein FhaB/FipA n=1 Tax=unclassified Brevibacterium TaxID=2614124 RepID=UPI00108087D2|nr:FHA domain-containing protein [Brevibacterium sp. S111]TGD12925.1 FHA domain-containing protein [Brevibacterium sp. S111]
MSEFTVTVFRLAFFVILWLFVLGVAGVLRRDIFGPRRSRAGRKSRRGGSKATAPPPARPAPAPRQAPAAAPVAHAHPGTIRITDGPLAGQSLMLSGAPVTFGRAPDNTIVINDDFASSHHARISAKNGAWLLEDLGSTNGTIVDGSRMTGPVRLSIGTRITIGHTTLETQS